MATTSDRSSLFLKYLNQTTYVISDAAAVVLIWILLTHAAYLYVLLSIRLVSQVEPPIKRYIELALSSNYSMAVIVVSAFSVPNRRGSSSLKQDILLTV